VVESQLSTGGTIEPDKSENNREAANGILWRGRDVALITSVSIVGVLGGILMLGLLFGRITGIDLSLIRTAAASNLSPMMYGVYVASIAALQAGIMIFTVWQIGLHRRHQNWTALWLRPLTPRQMSEATAFFLVLRIVAIVISLFLTQMGITSRQAQSIVASGVSVPTALATLFFIGILVPFAEEAFFRGVLYRWLRDRWGVKAGAIISSVIFGLVHLEIATAITATVLGLGLAYIYERHKSLWSCTLVHALNNLSALVLLYVLLASGVDVR
jgi:uncharacterized protein